MSLYLISEDVDVIEWQVSNISASLLEEEGNQQGHILNATTC